MSVPRQPYDGPDGPGVSAITTGRPVVARPPGGAADLAHLPALTAGAVLPSLRTIAPVCN